MGKNEFPLFNFDREKIFDHGNGIEELIQRRSYYVEVLNRKRTNVTILDNSKYDPEYNLEKELTEQIKQLDSIITQTKQESFGSIKEPIIWKGTKPTLLYLFELLLDAGLIDRKYNNNMYATLRDHFLDMNGRFMDNVSLQKAHGKMKYYHKRRTPQAKDATDIDYVLSELKEFLKICAENDEGGIPPATP